MRLSRDLPWTDLETRGFVHVPGFLTTAEIQSCVNDYASKPAGSSNGNFDVPGAGDGISVLTAAIGEAVTAITATTAIRVDSFVGASYFATKRGIRFNWHQDHESYFLFQTHVNYLNFY